VADNTILSAGSADGITLATDDVGGVHYQRVKVSWGADNSATDASAANPLPVVQTGTLNVGTVTAVTGITNALPAGTNNIGDVDVLTVPADPFGANADAASATGSISAKLRFIASTGIPITGTATVTGAGGTFPVTDSAGSLTVDAPVGTPVFVRLSDGSAAITNLATNVAQINGVTPLMGAGATGTGSHRVTIATDGQGQVADNAGFTDTATRLDMAGFIFDEVAGTALTENDAAAARIDSKRALVNVIEDATTRGQRMAVSAAGAAATNVAQVAGTTTATGNGTASAGCQRVTVASDNTAFAVNATLKPTTSGGLTVATGSIAATKTDIKGSAGQVYGWYFYNPNASVAYVQFFNTAAAGVTLGTTPPVYSLGIPATSGANVMSDIGIPHSTAICIAVTTTRAGSTGPGSTVDYNIYYS
jgi:hypothetical protein